MNAQLSPVPEQKSPSLKPGQVFLKGRISSRRKITTQNGPRYLTLVKLPAADAYSSPSTVEVTSTESLGASDEDWTGLCQVGGYGRNFNGQNSEGEKVTIYTASMTLTFIG